MGNLSNEILHNAMVNFCSGKITEDQSIILLNWIESDDRNRKYFNDFCESWRLSAYLSDNYFDIEEALKKVNENINEKGNRPSESIHLVLRINLLFKVAVAIVILLLAGGIYSMVNSILSTGQEDICFYEAVSPKGSRAFIKMPDSSSIWLNADTKIRYTNRFGMKDREIYLEGEAYFNVHKSETRLPFRVITSDVSITALGTAFNVKSYLTEDVIETTLEEGSLKIEPIRATVNKTLSKPVLLMPNQSAVYKKESETIALSSEEDRETLIEKRSEITNSADNLVLSMMEPIKIIEVSDTKIFTSWKDNRWIIKNEKLNILIPKLERRYDVTITLMDQKAGNFAVSATLVDESLEQVLEAIRFVAPIRYDIRSKCVYVYTDVVLETQYSKALTMP